MTSPLQTISIIFDKIFGIRRRFRDECWLFAYFEIGRSPKKWLAFRLLVIWPFALNWLAVRLIVVWSFANKRLAVRDRYFDSRRERPSSGYSSFRFQLTPYDEKNCDRKISLISPFWIKIFDRSFLWQVSLARYICNSSWNKCSWNRVVTFFVEGENDIYAGRPTSDHCT